MNVRMYLGENTEDDEEKSLSESKRSVRVVVSLLPTSQPAFFVREKYRHLRQPFD